MKNLFLFCFFSLAIMGFSQEKLRVGIIKYKTEEKVNTTFPPLMKYVAEKLGKDVLGEIIPEDELDFSRIMNILIKKNKKNKSK